MIYYSEFYKDIYNLSDQESKFFEQFFANDEVSQLLLKIRNRVYITKILSILSIFLIPSLIIGIFYLIYLFQGISNEHIYSFIVFFYFFLMFGMMILYIRFYGKNTFTKYLSNEISKKLMSSLDKDFKFDGDNKKGKKSRYYIQMNDLLFYGSGKDGFLDSLSMFLGTFTNSGDKGNLAFGEYVEEKFISYDIVYDNKSRSSFLLNNIDIDEEIYGKLGKITIMGQEAKRLKDVYYATKTVTIPHSYFYRVKFNDSKLDIDQGIKLWRKARSNQEDNYYLEIFLLGIYMMSVLYYIDAFVVELIGINTKIYNILMISILIMLILYFIVGFIKRVSNMSDDVDDKKFQLYCIDEKYAKKVLVNDNFLMKLSLFAAKGFDKKRNYEIYFKGNEVLIKYDIRGVNWQVENIKYIHDPFIRFYLDNRNVLQLIFDLSKNYY